ncbi:unnamed protein product, partial [Staurois parvus]
PRTLHSLYPLSPDPAFTISGLPGPCIHYIWSPQTLYSLYLVSSDPAFTISGLPGHCIHYIRSPWTLYSLYLVSPDPAFTISGLPQYTQHGNAPSPPKKGSLARHTKLSMCSLPPSLCTIRR